MFDAGAKSYADTKTITDANADGDPNPDLDPIASSEFEADTNTEPQFVRVDDKRLVLKKL
jgi:hypothetical protein